MASILIIDDEEAIAWSLKKALEREHHTVRVAATAEDGLQTAREFQPQVAFIDIRLPGLDGLSALEKLKAISPNTKSVIITAHGNLGTAVKAVEGGAFDYLAKPFDLSQVMDVAARALVVETPNDDTFTRPAADELLGRSPAMQTVFKRIALVAPTDAGVLISGESGTGKELVARAIHAHSLNKAKPFLPVHVAALNPNLVESELFGHAKGAFTGADRAKPGLLQLAAGGTVFLDELADIPLPIQAKLLRVLERKEVFPVGGATAIPVDFRIVSATHADLSLAVRDGRFRHDLLYRLNVYPIHVPALRDHIEDIAELAEHFLQQFGSTATLAPETVAALKSRSWPGNVRELRNALEQASIHARGGPILPEFLPEPMSHAPASSHEKLRTTIRDWTAERMRAADVEELYQRFLEEAEPALLGEVLRHLDSNRLAAARTLGLARATVRKLVRKYDLLPDGDADDTE